MIEAIEELEILIGECDNLTVIPKPSGSNIRNVDDLIDELKHIQGILKDKVAEYT